MPIAKTYTLNADFDLGTLVDVNHDVPHQLQLSIGAGLFGFMMIPLGQRSSCVRVNVDTGAILGEYLTRSAALGGNAGRCVIDSQGNAWLTNRAQTVSGSAVKIGIVVGGTRTNAAGTPDPTGEYLAPPYDYSTCVDRDSDGLIRTSTGINNALSWPDATDGGDGTPGDPATVTSAQDECILLYPRMALMSQCRHVSLDANDNAWIGSYPDFEPNRFMLISGSTGETLTSKPVACGGYTGIIDTTGVLWSSSSAPTNQIRRYDPTVGGSGSCIGTGVDTNPAGIAQDGFGRLWVVCATALRIYNLSGTFVSRHAIAGAVDLQGVVIDASNTVWVSDRTNDVVYKVNGSKGSEGVLLDTIAVAADPTGLDIDYNGKLWVVALSDTAQRIDTTDGTIDLTVAFPAGSLPFCLTDGFTSSVPVGGMEETGTWTVTFDGAVAGVQWGTVAWASNEESDSSISVQVRANNDSTLLPLEVYLPVTNGQGFTLTGRYIQVQVEFAKASAEDISPILFDLTVNGELSTPETALFWDGKHGGWWEDEFAPSRAIRCSTVFDGDSSDDRFVAVGCADGGVRIFSNTAADDDGEAIESELWLGPFVGGLPDAETRFSHLQTVLASDQNTVDFEWYVSEEPDTDLDALVLDGAAASGTLLAGLSPVFYQRVRGLYIWLRLVGAGPTWAYEAGSLLAAPGGRARQRPDPLL